MKSPGFNPAQLVARGVFDSLEEADAVLCDFDDARPGATVVAVSWLQGFKFQVPILPQGEIGRAANLAGYNKADADRPKDWVGSPNKPLMRKVNGACVSRPLQGIACQNLPSACAVGAVGLPNRLGSAVEAGSGPGNKSQRSPELLPESASVLCPWCAVERSLSGQGSAPRTGFVAVARCDRHTNESPAPSLAVPQSPNQAGRVNPDLLSTRPALPLRGADRGADVRISARGVEYFIATETRSVQSQRAEDVVVSGRSPGEAKRELLRVVGG